MNARKVRVLLFVACLLPVDALVSISLIAAQLVAFVLGPFRFRRVAQMPAPRISSVTIQILSWDGRQLLEEFLPSVLAASGGHEVVVVDNGSTDGSVELLKAKFPGVRIVSLDRNYGFSDGNNRGMKHVTTAMVVPLS